MRPRPMCPAVKADSLGPFPLLILPTILTLGWALGPGSWAQLGMQKKQKTQGKTRKQEKRRVQEKKGGAPGREYADAETQERMTTQKK